MNYYEYDAETGTWVLAGTITPPGGGGGGGGPDDFIIAGTVAADKLNIQRNLGGTIAIDVSTLKDSDGGLY